MEQPDPTGSPPPAYNPAPDNYAQVISNGPINAPRPEVAYRAPSPSLSEQAIEAYGNGLAYKL